MALRNDFSTAVKPALTSFFQSVPAWPKGYTANQVVERISKGANYPETVLDGQGQPIPNPQSRADYVVDKLFNFIADSFKAGDRRIIEEGSEQPGDINNI